MAKYGRVIRHPFQRRQRRTYQPIVVIEHSDCLPRNVSVGRESEAIQDSANRPFTSHLEQILPERVAPPLRSV
jgi:hypothetical protein